MAAKTNTEKIDELTVRVAILESALSAHRREVDGISGSSVFRCNSWGFRTGRDFLWLTAGKSARWAGRNAKLLAKDGHGQHHHRHRSA